jgi:hypothetical protein
VSLTPLFPEQAGQSAIKPVKAIADAIRRLSVPQTLEPSISKPHRARSALAPRVEQLPLLRVARKPANA